MAAVSTSDLLSVLATIFEEEVTPQWNRATVLANVLPKSEGMSRNINVDVEDSDGQGATGYTAYTDGSDISTYTPRPDVTETLSPRSQTDVPCSGALVRR
jgi:hypothetical protein